MRRQLVPGLRMLALLTVPTGLLYTLGITAISQFSMASQADGSIVVVDGEMVGSKLIGQAFATDGLFPLDPRLWGTTPGLRAQPTTGPATPNFWTL